MGDYVLNSALIHLALLTVFRILVRSELLDIPSPFRQDSAPLFRLWAWSHWRLILLYFLTSLLVGPLYGFGRGVVALKQPIRKGLLNLSWSRVLLSKIGVNSFLEPDPVWYGVLRNVRSDEITFLQVRLKNGGFYTGELRSYGLVADKEKQKDFYIVNPYFRASSAEDYQKLEVDGVLLSFADADAVEIVKQTKMALQTA